MSNNSGTITIRPCDLLGIGTTPYSIAIAKGMPHSGTAFFPKVSPDYRYVWDRMPDNSIRVSWDPIGLTRTGAEAD